MSINRDDLSKALDFCYEKALNGIPGVSESVAELADDYLKQPGNLKKNIDDMCDFQVYKCTTSGFLTGLGGAITMPVTVPANITSVLYVQIRMVATVAYMCGFDVKDDKVKTLVYATLCGNSAAEVLRDCGIKLAEKLTEKFILKKISGEVITKINSEVGFRLLTKMGSKGIINLGKAVPLIGGIVGGGIDYVTTKTIATVSKRVFYKRQLKE